MAFVYPGILWLLSLISIPIIIHLFHFRRYKTLYFSSLQFIQKIDQEKITQINIYSDSEYSVKTFNIWLQKWNIPLDEINWKYIFNY
jgi:hypothetical protein